MPLVVFDLETTGVNVATDRIVEMGIARFDPGQEPQRYCLRINPGVSIPVGATKIHGISNQDVACCPRFEEVAGSLLAVFAGAALAGYNIKKFDGPMLSNHFLACGMDMGWDKRVVIDSMEIFHAKLKRDLAGALMYYCGLEHEGAHGAMADVDATVLILDEQVRKYAAPPEVSKVALWAVDDGRVDAEGKFRWDGDVCRITFGKHSGMDVREMAANGAHGFLAWILKGDFSPSTKKVASDILSGRYPEKIK